MLQRKLPSTEAQDSSKHFSRGLLLNLAAWNSESKLHLEKKYSRYHDVRVLKDLPTDSQSFKVDSGQMSKATLKNYFVSRTK